MAAHRLISVFGSSVRAGSLVFVFTLFASVAVAVQPPAGAPPGPGPAKRDDKPDRPAMQADRETAAKAERIRLANLLAPADRSRALGCWRLLIKRQLDILNCLKDVSGWESNSDSDSDSESSSDSEKKTAYFVVTLNDKDRKDDDVFGFGMPTLVRVELHDEDNVTGGSARFTLSQEPAPPDKTGAVKFVDKSGKKIDPNKPRTVFKGIPNEEVYAEGTEIGHVTIAATDASCQAQ